MAKKETAKAVDLKDVLAEIEKEYGEGTISKGRENLGPIDVIPFSIPSMNRISGIGGIARGRITEFHGMDGTYKSTLAFDLIRSCQEMGGTAILVDAEYAYSEEYAASCGVDIDELIVVHTESAEKTFTIMEKLVATKKADLIVVDSIAALSPETELENEFGKSNIGVMARLMGQMFRKVVATVGKTNTALVFINQLREQLGGYVPMKTTPGGNALRFYASMRFEINKTQIKDGTDIKGVTLKVRCVKNKLGIPYLTTELESIYGKGIDIQKDLITECAEANIIKKGGAGWFELSEGVKLQGLDNVKQFLIDNPEFEEELKEKLYGQK